MKQRTQYELDENEKLTLALSWFGIFLGSVVLAVCIIGSMSLAVMK